MGPAVGRAIGLAYYWGYGMSGTPVAIDEGPSVTAETVLELDTADALWGLYELAFAGLTEVAAARQLLSRADFTLEVLDRRVVKYLARAGDGRIVGLCTLSTDLETVPWISPEFYRARYPGQFARRAVFYCGIAMVDPGFRNTRAFPDMVAALGRAVAAADGVLVADMCRFNVDEVQLAATVTRMLRRTWGAARQVELDRQLYLAWEPGPPVAS